jgi:hypothetical protein
MTLESTVSQDLVPSEAEKLFAQASAAGLDWQSLGAPVVEDVDRIVAALDPIADGAMTIIAQPDVPRTLTVTVVDANDSASGTVTIQGTDFIGLAISDAFTFGGGLKTFESTQVYATVTSVVISGTAGAAAGDTLSVGVGSLIGLPKPIVNEEAVKLVTFAAVPVTPDAVATGALELCGVDVTSQTYDGASELKVAYRPGQ